MKNLLHAVFKFENWMNDEHGTNSVKYKPWFYICNERLPINQFSELKPKKKHYYEFSCNLMFIMAHTSNIGTHKYECFHYHNMQLLISLCWCCLPRYTIKPSAKCFYIDDAGTKSQTNFNIGVYHHILYMEFLLKLKTTGTQLWYNKCNFKSNSAIWQHIPCFLRETVSSPYWFYINKETLQGLERQVKELGVNITNGDVRHKLLVTKVNVKYLYNNLSSI